MVKEVRGLKDFFKVAGLVIKEGKNRKAQLFMLK
jgi:hypothetical protein